MKFTKQNLIVLSAMNVHAEKLVARNERLENRRVHAAVTYIYVYINFVDCSSAQFASLRAIIARTISLRLQTVVETFNCFFGGRTATEAWLEFRSNRSLLAKQIRAATWGLVTRPEHDYENVAQVLSPPQISHRPRYRP